MGIETSIQVGKRFENQAKQILEHENFKIIEHTSELCPLSHYDFVVEKDGIRYFLEVRGREGKNKQYFFFSKNKLNHLRDLKSQVLIILINENGYCIFNLNNIYEYSKVIRIQGKNIYITTSKHLYHQLSRKKKIIKIGKSLGFIIDKTIIKENNFKAGDEFEIDIDYDKKKIEVKKQ